MSRCIYRWHGWRCQRTEGHAGLHINYRFSTMGWPDDVAAATPPQHKESE